MTCIVYLMLRGRYYQHKAAEDAQLFTYDIIVLQARLILCYTEWLKNWVLLDWKVHAQRRRQLEGNEMDEEVDDM